MSPPKTSFSAASKLSAGYRPSAKYDTRNPRMCDKIGMRDTTGTWETQRGLNALFAKDSKIFAQSSTGHPMINNARTISPPGPRQRGPFRGSCPPTGTGAKRNLEIILHWDRYAHPVLQDLQKQQRHDSLDAAPIDGQYVDTRGVRLYLYRHISKRHIAEETAPNVERPPIILIRVSEDSRAVLADRVATGQIVVLWRATQAYETGVVASHPLPAKLKLLQIVVMDRHGRRADGKVLETFSQLL